MCPNHKMKLFGAACAVPHLSPHDLPLNTAFPGQKFCQGLSQRGAAESRGNKDLISERH